MALMEVGAARRLILQQAVRKPARTTPLRRALGRVAAAGVTSSVDIPPFAKSAMDGFALRAEDAEVGRPLRILERVVAGGRPGQPVVAGTCVRIMTGAEIPPGADAVVPLEQCHHQEGSRDMAVATSGIRRGWNIIPAGQSIQRGASILSAGRALGAVELAVLAEIGCTSLPVYRIPRVAVVATGDELVAPEQQPGPGQIRNSNSTLLAALVRQCGARPVDLGVVGDQIEVMAPVIDRALEMDVVLLSGGVSMGDLDLVPEVLGRLGVRQVLHGVNLRPGKPLWFGVRTRSDEGGSEERRTLVFGLPGNPVSGLVCFHLFVRPVLAYAGGREVAADVPLEEGRLAAPFSRSTGRPTFWPARTADGQPVAVQPLDWKGSSDLRTLMDADGLLAFPAGDHRWHQGQTVSFLRLAREAVP